MPPAEFEEPEYEAPLYNQLERQCGQLWAPGRVLERHLGFDRGLHVVDPLLWQLHGMSRPRAGAALARYAWPTWWGGRHLPKQPKLPSFRLNVFLQAKRSHRLRVCPKHVRQKGVVGPAWSFSITPHQQRLLEELATRTAGRTLVAYAAPVFHERADLYRHTRRATIVAHSTFPSVQSLSGHQKWYYASPGAKGAANPDPEFIEEASLPVRIGELIERQGGEGITVEEDSLALLASAVLAAANEESLLETEQRARFFDELLVIERELGGSDPGAAALDFLRVAHFAETFELSWFVVG